MNTSQAVDHHPFTHHRAVRTSAALIASGLDVKVVQAQSRHASATTTLNVYGHLWPDSDESARTAIAAVLNARTDALRTAAIG